MATLLSKGLRVLAAAGLMLGATFAVTAPAQASDTDAIIRGAHFSPTTPGVDVYLGSFSGGTSKVWLNSVSYGMVSPYQRLKPGLYAVAMRAAGAPSSSPPVLSWTLNAQAGKAYTVAGVGAGASVQGIVIADDLTTPPPGEGRVRVIQAASRVPVATVKVTNGPVIAANAAFATATAYETVPAGTWTLSAASAANASNPNPVSTSTSISVVAGVSTSVLVLDAKSTGITLRTVLDSSSAGTVPVGSVPAGGGGTAPLPVAASGHIALWLMIAFGSAGGVGVLLVGAARRQRGSAGSAGRHALG